MRKFTSIASNRRMGSSNSCLVHRIIALNPLIYRPSSLDAYFFGHLAQIMTFPAKLRVQLQNFPNLIAYYEGIMNAYFAPSLGDSTSDNLFLVGILPKRHIHFNRLFISCWLSITVIFRSTSTCVLPPILPPNLTRCWVILIIVWCFMLSQGIDLFNRRRKRRKWLWT